jgi:hypothetical protein
LRRAVATDINRINGDPSRQAAPARPAACGPYNYGKKLIRDEVNAGFRASRGLIRSVVFSASGEAPSEEFRTAEIA